MLIKLSEFGDRAPIIKKRIDGTDVSQRGCFEYGECPEFTAEVPRMLGTSAVVLRIQKDGCDDVDIPFSFIFSNGVDDVYSLVIDTVALCGDEEDGLFFYEILFLRGADTLFTSSSNNVDFELSRRSAQRFVLMVYKKGFCTPSWFAGRTMYQIFVDRFFKGEGEVGERDDVIINDDWYGGIPQYAEIQGQDVDNNMFFGGNLWGVAEKLEYLKEMGVGVIYLNPIFKAYSNHKYDTADYLQIDSMFGGEKAFEHLIKRAESLDIKIILDGVFNHTGDNSLYFDRYGEYGGVGAYQSENSVYRKWFRFGNTSDEFESWWGIKILPRLNHETHDCRRFFTAENGVGAEYIKKGVAGWRLDVADELCDRFLDEFSESVKKASDGQAIVIGEVWENAATKEAYGKRRRYLRGDQLHSVMNYPIREGIIDFVLNGNAQVLADTLKSIYSTYPKPVSDALMNILGTHDTERILTVLGKKSAKVCRAMGSQLAHKRLSSEELNYAVQGLMIAATLQYTVYGVPSLYYGDEAGVEGYRDPFCRLPYPWGRENKSIFEHYKALGRIRTENTDIFATGEFSVIRAEDGIIAYKRQSARGAIIVVANANEHQIDCKINGEWTDLLTNRKFVGCVLPRSAVILRQE